MGNLSLNDVKRNVTSPNKESKKLAEFFGILTGDGYMNTYRKYDYVIEIAGNKLYDKDYLVIYVSNLIKELFNVSPRYIEKKNQNSIYLRIRSKVIFNYLLNNDFKKGRKGNIKIPAWVINNKEFMKYFIKGLFDTDGCISIKNKEGKKYPVISITSKSNLLLLDVMNYVKSIEINSYITRYVHINPRYTHKLITYKLQVNGYSNLNLWFNLIGSSNKRNINKYNFFKSYKTKA